MSLKTKIIENKEWIGLLAVCALIAAISVTTGASASVGNSIVKGINTIIHFI